MLPSSMLADRFTGNMMVLSSIPAPQIRAFVFGTGGRVGIWIFLGMLGILGILNSKP